MKRCAFVLVAALLCLSFATQSQATVITFDDLATPNSFNSGIYAGTMYWADLPESYAGFTWLPTGDYGWNVDNGATFESAYGNTYGPPSGPNFVSDGGDTQAFCASGAVFTFQGAYFSSWAVADAFSTSINPVSATSLTVEGLNGNTVLYTDTFALSPSAFVWRPENFVGITSVEFISNTPVSDNGGDWLMDNFTYTETPVPEPVSMVFFATGLVALGGYLARRRMLSKV